MATFEQDLIVFEDDTLLLQYTFSDLQGEFDFNWGGYWAAWSYDDWTNSRSGSNNAGNPLQTGSWNTPPEPDLEKNNDMTVAGGGTLPTNNDFIVGTQDNIIKIYFNQSDFVASSGGQPGQLATDVEYYTELLLSPTNNESTSVVAATGKLFISSSIFSTSGYRP